MIRINAPFIRNIVLIMVASCSFALLTYQLNKHRQPVAQQEQGTGTDTLRASLHINHDTVLTTINHDTLRLKEEEYNRIAACFPSLISGPYAPHPDILYLSGAGYTGIFESEAGRDNFCEVYYFFIMQRKEVAAQNAVRQQLQELFTAINTLEGRLYCGGTYFGHRAARLPAYAAYAASQYTYYQTEDCYDISRQRQHYIAMLRQMAADETAIADDCANNDRPTLAELLAEIDRLITNKFYLQQCQKFQYRGYDFE